MAATCERRTCGGALQSYLRGRAHPRALWGCCNAMDEDVCALLAVAGERLVRRVSSFVCDVTASTKPELRGACLGRGPRGSAGATRKRTCTAGTSPVAYPVSSAKAEIPNSRILAPDSRAKSSARYSANPVTAARGSVRRVDEVAVGLVGAGVPRRKHRDAQDKIICWIRVRRAADRVLPGRQSASQRTGMPAKRSDQDGTPATFRPGGRWCGSDGMAGPHRFPTQPLSIGPEADL
jgi:hypothetical protein